MRTAPSYSISSYTNILLETAISFRTPTGSSQNWITANSINGSTEIIFTGLTTTSGNQITLVGNVNFSSEL